MGTEAAKWLNRGFFWVLSVPLAAFALALILDLDSLVHVGKWGRSSSTDFPVAACIFIGFAVISVITSSFAAIKFSSSVPTEGLRKFKEIVMLRRNNAGIRSYDSWAPFVFLSASLICIGLLLYGPVDLAIMSGPEYLYPKVPRSLLLPRCCWRSCLMAVSCVYRCG